MNENSKLYDWPERDRSLGYLTNWAARLYAREMDAALKPIGLASGQLPVIFALAGDAALSQRDLARIASVEQPTMANTLSRMERDGLIERHANPADARSSLVALSKDARERLPKIASAVEAINARSRAGLTEAEAEMLEGLLLKVVAALQDGRD